MRNGQGTDYPGFLGGKGDVAVLHPSTGATCRHCQAWRGELGSEPTLDQFVAHLVAIFREVRRVLHPSGVCFVNLGDGYAAGGNGNGLKPKDMIGAPWTVAMALRADGWWLRSAMPWIKRSAMPQPVQDRPSTATETVFLLSKSAKYFWDAEAVRRPQAEPWRGHGEHERNNWSVGTANGNPTRGGVEMTREYNPSGRSMRDTDLYFDSLDILIEQERAYLADLIAMRESGGLLCDEDGLPLALDVNTAGFAGAHFATFAPKLITPLIKAGSSEHGVCGKCLAPWRRVVEQTKRPRGDRFGVKVDMGRFDHGQAGSPFMEIVSSQTTGWQPTCQCQADIVPATVLDPFLGSGTTLVVASRLGRNGVGIELNPEYAEMARARIATEGAPLFAEAIEEPDAPALAQAEMFR